MYHESRLVQHEKAWRAWDSVLEKKANSEKQGYCLQIPGRLSHTHVLQVLTLQPEWGQDGEVVKGKQISHYKEALSKGQSCPGGFSEARHGHDGCWEKTQALMGVTLRIPSKPEWSVLSLPSYFTPSSGCDIRHHFCVCVCVCDIHTPQTFFFSSRELLSTSKKDRGECSLSPAT